MYFIFKTHLSHKILHFNLDTKKFNAKALGNNIQVARDELKLKRADLADIVDVSLRTMASIEGRTKKKATHHRVPPPFI